MSIYKSFLIIWKTVPVYGMTETGLTTSNPPKGIRLDGKDGSVGQVTRNSQMKLISSETGKEVGPGEIGEIFVKSPCVTPGYYNKPDLNQEIFKDGWFITGDQAYYDEDEYIYIVERTKELIKYNAFQVAPAELEGILREHPAIQDCAVVGKQDERCGELPTAFVVTRSDISDSEIVNYVANRVSDYKQLRGGVVFIKEIPKTQSGKIIRRELKRLL